MHVPHSSVKGYHGLRNLKLKKGKISSSEVYIFVFYMLKGSSSHKIKIFGRGNQKLFLSKEYSLCF